MRIDPYRLGLWLIILGIPCSRAIVEIGATLLIGSWLWQKWQAGDLTLRRSPLSAPLALFVAWAALSLLWSQHPALTLKSVVWQLLEYAAIYLAVSDWLRTKRWARQAVWLWLGWSAAMVRRASAISQGCRSTIATSRPFRNVSRATAA